MLEGYRMFQVSMGLVPVCTMVGKADNVPSGVAGIFEGAGAAAAERFDMSVLMAMKAAVTAANWLVFMAGCKGEMSGNTFHPGPQEWDFF